MDCEEFFFRFFLHRKKFQKKGCSNLRESCSWQVFVTKVYGELNLRRKLLIPNISIRRWPLANSNFIRKFLFNEKMPHGWFEVYFGRFQFVASKVILEF